VNRCPITYLECGDADYSSAGLRLLNNRLAGLSPLSLSAAGQRREALRLAGKPSIPGVQPKLSAVLSVAGSVFKLVERRGLYILKPQHADYPGLPENEGITMHMARVAGLEVPVSGMVFSADGSLTYFIRRFDRVGRTRKLATEDFAQLAGLDRDSKYSFSMERVVEQVDRHCTFPVIEKARLFRRTVFCWLTGNEDMHTKNFSLISRSGKVELSPLYDCLNTTVVYRAIGRPLAEIDEIALPLNGRKKKLLPRDLLDYFGRERLGLPGKVIDDAMGVFSGVMAEWLRLLGVSFLDDGLKDIYTEVLVRRKSTLGL
jgi:serine/threonine-protein kinase HipA